MFSRLVFEASLHGAFQTHPHRQATCAPHLTLWNVGRLGSKVHFLKNLLLLHGGQRTPHLALLLPLQTLAAQVCCGMELKAWKTQPALSLPPCWIPL